MNCYDYYITPDEYDHASKLGIRPSLLEVRIRTLGWRKEKAMNIPPHKKHPLKDWVEVAEANGICYSTLRYRANRLGWDLERAATQPLQDRKAQAKRARENSRVYPIEILKLVEENNIPYDTFRMRVNRLKWDMYTAATKPVMTWHEIGLQTKERLYERGYSCLGNR